MLTEFIEEAEITKRVLQRVPGDKLSWTPHPKSMTLGQLALHVAKSPGEVAGLARMGAFDVSTEEVTPPSPGSKEEILTAHHESVAAAGALLEELTPDAAAAPWTLTNRGNEVLTIRRDALIRSILLNHWYHHRGQLSVYLRMLDVPVPVIYGRSADEDPFANPAEPAGASTR